MSTLPEGKAIKSKGAKKGAKMRSNPPPSPTPDVAEIVSETEAELCPYDENLLERARNQWQFGDWESLAQLSRETLQHHPDRAKLALLAAAGHLQLGDTNAARQFTRLAQEWGCGQRLISQILIAGVHNTLARAAAISGQRNKALGHFEAAIAAGAPGGDRNLLTQARIGKQLEQLGLPDTGNLFPAMYPANMPRPSSLGESMLAIREQIKVQKEELAAQVQKQQVELVRTRKALEKSLQSEMLNATKQIEAFLGVQNYLRTGELTGNMHGWPISPDFALNLIHLLETNDYDLVIEFGSGTSTVLIAKTLVKIATRRQEKFPVRQVAFEHLEKYYEQTLTDLQQAGLAETVQLVHAQLVPFTAPNGNTYSYYDCHQFLEKLVQELTPATALRILVIVDGPPGATGKHARYPAEPLILSHFSCTRIDFLLDDYNRDDEKEIVQIWLSEIQNAHYQVNFTELKLEKGACLISLTI